MESCSFNSLNFLEMLAMPLQQLLLFYSSSGSIFLSPWIFPFTLIFFFFEYHSFMLQMELAAFCFLPHLQRLLFLNWLCGLACDPHLANQCFSPLTSMFLWPEIQDDPTMFNPKDLLETVEEGKKNISLQHLLGKEGVSLGLGAAASSPLEKNIPEYETKTEKS